MRVALGDPAEREVDSIAADDPLGERVELHEPREQRALRVALVVVELPDERGALDRRGAEAGRPGREVVDDAVAADRLDPGLEAVERESQWKYWPPSITIVCPVTNDARGAAEVRHGADDVLRLLVALDRPRGDGHVAKLLDHLGVLLHALREREAGRDAVDADRRPCRARFASARVKATIAPLLVT